MKTITLSNLEESTAQEVFDHVVAHARKQGVKSGYKEDYKGRFVCMYRDEQNNSCFAGCLISDQEYIDYDVVNNERTNWATMISNIKLSTNHLGLIRRMQTTHDQHEVYDWEKRFESIANTFGLVYDPVLTNL